MKPLLLLLALALCTLTHAQTRPPRLCAVVVGISRYSPDNGIRSLQFADRDAEQFTRLLNCTDSVQVDTVITLLNEDATIGNLDMALKYLRQLLSDTSSRKPDYIVFYFSGHGQLSKYDDEQEGHFILYDTDCSSSLDLGYGHTDLVRHVKQWVNKCKKVIVIADACHSGRFSGSPEEGLPPIESLTKFSADQSGRFFELLSGTGNGKSYEDAYLKHGIFTYFLIRGALGEAYGDDDLLEDTEIGAYVKKMVKNADQRQLPKYNLNDALFLQFRPCMDYSGISQVSTDTLHAGRGIKSLDRPLPLEIEFDSLLAAGIICLPTGHSAYQVLQLTRNKKEYEKVYENMRSRYIRAVLEEDARIMHRYLNQDMNPWLTRFADIEKEIQMQKSMLEMLRPDDLLAKKTAARFFFFQAMEWYEYAKFVPGAERIARLKKADKLIARSLKIKPDSPTAYFLQSQIYLGLNPGGKAKARPAQLAEIRKRAPGWRLPYLYARDRASLQRYAAMAAEYREYATRPTQQPPLPASLTTETGKPFTPEQMAKAFSGNPLLAEDLYLGHALEGKSPEKALKKHRKMAVSAYNLSLKASGVPVPPAPDKSPATTELARLETDNRKADNRVEEEIRYEKQLDADTVVSEATKARWAELSRLENTRSNTSDQQNSQTESSSFDDPLVGRFILVKGGTFNMGCTSEQQDCNDDEKPVHPVTLSDYYIGETEVTQAQWKAVMGDNPSKFKYCGEDCPVEQVSWDDVQLFISRLNARAGVPKYRLPTEAEWEYAARGGANSRGFKYAGSSSLDEVAWYPRNSGTTHPVKGKNPNELGIYDMSGNVREWCSDWYDAFSVKSLTNPQGPEMGIYRVCRGSSWIDSASISARFNSGPVYLDVFLGFRLAAAIPDTSSQKTGNVPPKNNNKSSDGTGFATGMKEKEPVNEPEKERTETPESNPTLPPAAITNGKDSFTDPLLGKFILVKGGTFNMGCTSEQQDCSVGEKPVHPVTLGDYYIAETEVTQAQWKAVMGDNPSSHMYCVDCPVERVSWNDVQEFITRLNARAGSPRYRLPTEAEWEYAARGGANSRGYQFSGSNDINEVAWYGENSGDKTYPTKGKKPNELGVYDMSGNVYEWCSDRYGYYSAASQTNPQGPSEGVYRVYRGGSCYNYAGCSRASNRNLNEPGFRHSYLGFRLSAAAPR
jgi:formylglycine-generating enzyme required for sulfatase activity